MKKIIYILALLGLCVEHACAEYAYECAIDGEGQDMTFPFDYSTWVQYEEDQANGDKCLLFFGASDKCVYSGACTDISIGGGGKRVKIVPLDTSLPFVTLIVAGYVAFICYRRKKSVESREG